MMNQDASIEGERQQEVQRDGLYGVQWLCALPGWISIIIIIILSFQFLLMILPCLQ